MRSFRGLSALFVLFTALASCEDNTVMPDSGVIGCNGLGRSRCVDKISVGTRFGCAALGDQTVWCWGRNDESQLGYASTDLCTETLTSGGSRQVNCHTYPLQVTGLTRVTAVSAGGGHACARLSTGELRCWGGNSFGQLGNGLDLPSVTPVAVGGLTGVTSFAAGSRHSCAVAGDGKVYCWGANERGQLGTEVAPAACTSANVPCARTPVMVPGVTNAVEVVVGEAHSCARTMAGRVQCWGTNENGQLGNGTASVQPSPMPQSVLLGVSPLRAITALAAGSHHTCAMRDDGAVLCWGRHDRGQLGVAVPEMYEPCANACITSAVPIVGFEGAPSTEPDAGFPEPDGSSPFDGISPDATAPVDVARPMDVATPMDGGVGEGGDAAPVVRDVTITIDSGADSGEAVLPIVTAISAGSAFSCLSLDNGTVRCWGTNRSYELGNGMLNEGGATLTTVIASPGSAATNPLQGVVSVESGGSTTCALLTDHSIKCWGINELGALGIGNDQERNGPVAATW